MSLWKDSMNPHWRTDALREELRQAKEKIQRLEADQRRLEERLSRLDYRLRQMAGEPP